MSNDTKTVAATVTTLAALMAMTLGDIAIFIRDNFGKARVAYVEAAKGIVAVTKMLTVRYKKVPEPKRVFAELSKAGVSESNFRNGSQLAGLWPLLVETGLISEALFDQLDYVAAVDIRAVIRRETNTERGLPDALSPATAKLVQRLLTGKRDELSCWAENGCGLKEFAKRVEKLEADAKAAAKAAGTPPAAGTPEAAGTPAATDAGTKGKGKGKKGQVVPMNGGASNFATFEAFASETEKSADVCIAEGNAAVQKKVVHRLVALAKSVAEKVKAAQAAAAAKGSKGKVKVAKAA